MLKNCESEFVQPLIQVMIRSTFEFILPMKYEKHLFICTNQRAPGEKQSCGETHGLALVKEFKKMIKDRGLHVNIRAQKTGCLDVCELGPALVVYPEGIFYGSVSLADVPEIVNEHLVNNRPVERLRLVFPAKHNVDGAG